MVGTVRNSYIRYNSIHHTYNRGITIHGVHPLNVDNREPWGRYACPFPVSDAEYRETVSRVHLVDLAGSERVKRSGGSVETGAINKSLSTLGAVIHAPAQTPRTQAFDAVPIPSLAQVPLPTASAASRVLGRGRHTW